MKKTYDIAAYIWPAYTGDEPRTRIFWPEGMGEWQTVRDAQPKFEGHNWPRCPLRGFENEADPKVMEEQIDLAADHGVNVFIYDWYWYDGRPFLEQCLDNGYLQAKNNHRVKFYLMWANHDATSLWDKRTAERDDLIWRGSQNEEEFDKICDRVIEKYFHHPSYYKIGEKPVFMIYDVKTLVRGLGSLEKTAECLQRFRQKCVDAGFDGLELQVAQRGPRRRIGKSGTVVDSDETEKFRQDSAKVLGFDSLTNYQFVHFVDVKADYAKVAADAAEEYEVFPKRYGIPYYPHVSLGWDNNPRYTEFQSRLTTNNTPQAVEQALSAAKKYIDTHDLPAPLITVNSWNEWTEGSYLLPDDLYGSGYLEAVKKVFVDEI
jgi:hypothetical protein